MDTMFEEKPVEENSRYAGFWIRFAASLLDGIILSIPMTIIFVLAFFMMFASSGFSSALTDQATIEGNFTDQQILAFISTYIIVILLSIIIPLFYYAGMHASKWQATIGKKLLRLKVTDLNGNRISFWRALGRYLAMAFLSGIFFIGYIIAGFTDKKQALHDLIAGTVVTKED